MHTLKVRTRFNLLREAWQLARENFPAAAPLPEELDGRAVEAQLHATILEMAGACITLFERGNYWPVPVLLELRTKRLPTKSHLSAILLTLRIWSRPP